MENVNTVYKVLDIVEQILIRCAVGAVLLPVYRNQTCDQETKETIIEPMRVIQIVSIFMSQLKNSVIAIVN